ncbi:hypothetical protein [Lysobacter tyrosinilyticus]
MTTSMECSKGVSVLGLLLAAASAPVFAQVRLDKLNACNDVASAFEAVKAVTRVPGRRCLPPRAPLEKMMQDRAAGFGQLCFQDWSDQPLLDGFGCTVLTKGATSLVCVRPAKLSDLRSFKARYGPENSAAAVSYGLEAEKCPLYRGDVGPAQSTVHSTLLVGISKFEFGFIAALEGAPISSYVMHAFASIDPSLTGNAPGALEYIYYFVGGDTSNMQGSSDVIGRSWLLDVDQDTQFEAEMKKSLGRLPLPWYFDSTSFEVTKRYRAPAASNLTTLINEIYEVIGEGLEDEGFEEVDSSSSLGRAMNADDLSEMFREKIPYGYKGLMATKTKPKMRLMMMPHRGICSDGGEGGYVAFLYAAGPGATASSDQGDVGIGVVAIGECQRISSQARRFIRQLGKDAEILVRSRLQSE